MTDRTSKLIGAVIAIGLLLNFAMSVFDRLSPVQAQGPQPVVLFSREGRPLASSKRPQGDGSAVLLVETTSTGAKAGKERVPQEEGYRPPQSSNEEQ